MSKVRAAKVPCVVASTTDATDRAKTVTTVQASRLSVYVSWVSLRRNNPRAFASLPCPEFEYVTRTTSRVVTTRQCTESLRYYAYMDYITRSCSSQRGRVYVAPYMHVMYSRGAAFDVYTTMRTLLRWFHTSRAYGMGLLNPDDDAFTLYRHFHRVVDLYTREELQERLQDVAFLECLRAYLQQQKRHYMTREGWLECCLYFENAPTMQKVFPQAMEVLKDMSGGRGCRIAITTLFDGVPGHCFMYAILLHPSVPGEVKRMLLEALSVEGHIVPPRHVKGGPPVGNITCTDGLMYLFYTLEYNRSLPVHARPQVLPCESSEPRARPTVMNQWVCRVVGTTNDAYYHRLKESINTARA